MTIAIAATGPRAGLAVFEALSRAEKVGKGSIFGFCVYAVIKKDGVVESFATQRGGTETLVVDGEVTGVMPPQDVLNATMAVVVSSGPDRPGDLKRMLPADPQVGMVTGHRLPIALSQNRKPIMLEVFEEMAKGVPAQEAVTTVLGSNPRADVGIIALDRKGGLGIGNTQRVEARPDVATAKWVSRDGSLAAGVLLNEIKPLEVAYLALGVAREVLAEKPLGEFYITVPTGLKVAHGTHNSVEVDAENRAVRVVTEDDSILQGEQPGVVPYLGSIVISSNRRLGRTVNEPLTFLKEGVIVGFAGQAEARIMVAGEDDNA